jgi:predicted small secreted protein
MKKIFLILLSATLFTSCNMLERTTSSRTQDINKGDIVQKPLLVDLNVQETKVTGSAIGKTTSNIEQLKKEAVANALKTANADILVEPKYVIENTNRSITVTVTGYPATYKNFRQIKEEDINLIKGTQTILNQNSTTSQTSTNDNNASNQTQANKKKAVVGLSIVGILTTVLVIILAGAASSY